MEKLSTNRIEELLNNQQFYDIYVEESVDSTNSVIKQRAEDGAKEGTVLIALEQTEGRGRFGRSFCSPKGTGIYMSILFRPEKSADKSLVLTTAAALSVCKAIREMAGLDASIKWVNDILIDEKKVCGILTEGKITADTKLEYAVLGIGINMTTPEGGFPEEIKEIATSLEKSTTKDLAVKLVAKILDNLYFYYEDMDLNEEFVQYEYIACCSTIGRDINIINGDESTPAKAVGIAEDLSLLIRDEQGIRKISHGEISIRHKN